MGIWSISPNTGLASIDENGLAYFDLHSGDTVYTISYKETATSSAMTKNVTVKACPPVKCDFTPYDVIPAAGGTNIPIGTYRNNCTDPTETINWWKTAGTGNFLSNLTFSNGIIKANVAKNNTTNELTEEVHFATWSQCCATSKWFKQAAGTPVTNYTFTVYSNVEGATVNIGGSRYTITNGKAVHTSTDPSSKSVTISKAGYTFNPSSGTIKANNSLKMNGSVTPPPATCDTCAKIGVTHEWGTITIPAAASSNYTLAKFTTNCENPNLVAKEIMGTSFAQNMTVERTGTNTYRVVGTILENTSKQFARVQHIAVFLGSSQCGEQVILSQVAAAGCTCSVTGKTDITYKNATAIPIATYTASCTSNAVVSYVSGDQIIQTPTCTVSGGQIKASVNENTSIRTRTGTYALYFDNVKCAEFSITQDGKAPEPVYSYNITYTNETNVELTNIGCVVKLSNGNTLTYNSASHILPGGIHTSSIQRIGDYNIASVVSVYFSSPNHAGTVSSSCYTVSGLGGRDVGIRILCEN